MSAGGRGRGYLGRHHLRDDPARPGDAADAATRAVDTTRANPAPDETHSAPRSAEKTRSRDKPRSDKLSSNKSVRSDKAVEKVVKAHASHSDSMTVHSGEKVAQYAEKSARSSGAGDETARSETSEHSAHSNSGTDVNSRVEPARRASASARDESRPLGADDEQSLAELMLVDEQHKPIVTMLEQFSPGEDGIAFNRKLREFESTLTSMCQDDAELHHAFSSLRGAALGSAATARKLASVGASFTRQQRQNVLRMALLNIMQSTFAKLDVLERASPQILTNAATLMGDYFMEARLGNGSKVQLLCAPLLQYMRSLLASGDRRAHRALATQLMQNGRELITTNAQDLDELSISIRIRLLSPPPASIIWLLLSADLCINKFLPLPASLQSFYASNLDLMQEPETPQNYSEVSYGSWKKSPEKEDWKGEEGEADRGDVSLNVSEDSSTRKLRPILGAGAALSRQNNSFSEVSSAQDSQDVWNKSSLAKRYDLNSWRQQENAEEKDDSQEEFNASGDIKFVQSQQFVPNEGYREFQAPAAQSQPYPQAQFDGKFLSNQQQYDAKYAQKFSQPAAFAAGERYVAQPNLTTAPPPFPPHVDGKFTTPPPFVPERTVSVPNEKFSNPPPFVPDRTVNLNEGKFNTPPPFVPERVVTERPVPSQHFAEKQNFQSERPERLVNVERPVQNQHFAEKQSFQASERTERVVVERPIQNQHFTEKQSFQTSERPERVVNAERPVQSQHSVEKQNFQNSDRPRRPPENWRKEKSEEGGRQASRKVDWARQKSRDSEEQIENGEVVTRLDGSGDAKPFRSSQRQNQRESRPRQPRKEETEEAKVPARRAEKRMDVPRSHKYWDHDDRLDKDYNS